MVEFQDNKITLKIVYYGPALSGKTTNLMQLHDILNPVRCGDLMTLDTKGDRTLFFDFLPLLIKSESGFKVKVKLFTVPGQAAHDATRKAVLSRSDGVVFVADSQVDQSINNFESFENLEKNAARVGLDFENIPLVIQFNKRDLNNIISEKDIKDRWDQAGLPIIFSSAIYGKGVKETFELISMLTYSYVDRIYGLKKNYSITDKDISGIID